MLLSLQDITDRLTERVGNNSTFWTAPEKRDALNEAVSLWQAFTGEWTRAFMRPPVAGAWQEVPHQLISPQRVLFNSEPLTLISLAELDYGYPGWENEAAGTPRFWAPLGLNIIAIYPAVSDLSLPLTFEGITDAPWLFHDGDLLDIGEEELVPILDYAHHVLTFKEGGVEHRNTMGALKRFFDAAALRNSRLLQTNFYKRYEGLVREEEQRDARGGEKTIGARG